MVNDWDEQEITGKPPEEVGRDLISFMERTERTAFLFILGLLLDGVILVSRPPNSNLGWILGIFLLLVLAGGAWMGWSGLNAYRKTKIKYPTAYKHLK